MADEYDVSDLPAVVAANEATTAAAGIPVPHAPDVAPENLLTPEQMQDIDSDMQMDAKYGPGPLNTLGAAAVAAADTAGFSIPGRVLDETGILSKEAQKELRDRHSVADTIGTGVGMVAPLLVGDPEGLVGGAAKLASYPIKVAVQGGGEMAEKTAAKILAKTLGETGSKKVVQNIIRKSIEKGAQGAAEGGVQGFNQLLREDALGDVDLNADNLMSYVGTGALYGGLANAALPVVGAAFRGAAKGSGKLGKTLFDKVGKKFLDPSKAAEELSGLPASKVAKMESTPAGKGVLEDLPRWYTEDVGLSAFGDDAEKVVQKVSALEKKSGNEIESLLQQIDKKAETKILEAPLSRPKELGQIADELQAKYVAPNMITDPVTGRVSSMKAFRAQNLKITSIIDDIRSLGRQEGPLNAQTLVKLKRQMDSLAKGFYERGIGSAPSPFEKAAFKARDLVNQLGQKYAVSVDADLAVQLAKANQNVYYAKTVLPSLMKKASKDVSMLGLKDALAATVGTVLGGGPTGAAVYGAKKFMESDFRRRAVILSGIEKANLSIDSHVSDSIRNFFTKVRKPVRAALGTTLVASAIAQKREDGKKPEAPKTKLEAYNNAAKNIETLTVQSDKLLDKSVKATAGVAYAAPKTAEVMGQRMVSGIQFLQSKIPKRPYEAVFPSGTQKPYQPSSMELSKFERYLQVVDNPLSVLQDIESGTLTREHVEALAKVYPALYTKIRMQTLHELQSKSEAEIPYSKRVQLSVLMNIQGDASLIGRNIAGLQANFTAPEPGPGQPGGAPPTATGAANIDTASRAASDNEAFLRRRGAP